MTLGFTVNPHLAIAVSQSFIDAHDICVQGSQDVAVGKPALIPAVVCIAFACEVGLKAILAFEGKSSSKHELHLLFEQLSESSRNAVLFHTGYEEARFELALQAASRAFVEWRYVYESEDSQSVSNQFLQLLAASTQSVSKSLAAAAAVERRET